MSTRPAVGAGASPGGGRQGGAQAQEKAQQLADQAQEKAQEVAGQAQEMAHQVAGQAQEKVQQARGQAQSRLREQLDQRSSQAAEQINSQASDLRAVSDSLREQGKQGPADAADRLAGYAERVGNYLRDRDSDSLLHDAEDFGRRRPWAVAAGGAALGFAASRFLKASSSRRYDRRFPQTENRAGAYEARGGGYGPGATGYGPGATGYEHQSGGYRASAGDFEPAVGGSRPYVPPATELGEDPRAGDPGYVPGPTAADYLEGRPPTGRPMRG